MQKGGVTGSLLGQIPYGVLVFGSYEVYKQELMARFPDAKPMFIFATASLLGDLTGSFCLCPSEVIKQKMQAGMFRNEREALISIWRSKGPLGFYEGYTGGLVRDVPFRVAQLVSGTIYAMLCFCSSVSSSRLFR
jgi:solute carrier family 25 S-adenosylmethionine transporter 26